MSASQIQPNILCRETFESDRALAISVIWSTGKGRSAYHQHIAIPFSSRFVRDPKSSRVGSIAFSIPCEVSCPDMRDFPLPGGRKIPIIEIRLAPHIKSVVWPYGHDAVILVRRGVYDYAEFLGFGHGGDGEGEDR